MGLNINVVRNLITSDIFRHVAYFYSLMDLFMNIISLFSLFFKTVGLFVVKFLTINMGISRYRCVLSMWCVGKSTIFLRTKCHSRNYSGLWIIAMKPKVDEKFYTAALLLFYSPQESFQHVTSIHVSFLETVSFFTNVVPTVPARMSFRLYICVHIAVTYFTILHFVDCASCYDCW